MGGAVWELCEAGDEVDGEGVPEIVLSQLQLTVSPLTQPLQYHTESSTIQQVTHIISHMTIVYIYIVMELFGEYSVLCVGRTMAH